MSPEYSQNAPQTFPQSSKHSPIQQTALVIFDGQKAPHTYILDSFGKQVVTFGRGQSNSVSSDILLESRLVSRSHGQFVKTSAGWAVQDTGSTNGLICNDSRIRARILADGDILRIDDASRDRNVGVMILVTQGQARSWRRVQLPQGTFTIGRVAGNSLPLPNVNVSKFHAVIENGIHAVLTDNRSTNGTFLNGQRITSKHVLSEKDVITIANTRLVYAGGCLYFASAIQGISVEARDVVVTRGHGTKARVTCDHVSLRIEPGELVSVIGGSGAGKSTILNALSGYLRPASGHVYINGTDLYRHFDSLKTLIGYVPQQDIVYDTLTLYDSLLYTAKLRLPKDISPEEREQAIDRAIGMVELQEKKFSYIKDLSGGQRKRASIAVELLSDPSLIFLDEPCSGLDAGTELSLMNTLRNMANHGKTIILVTHSTLQLAMCDKVVFMGRGGKLCYCGPLASALSFFGIQDVVQCYSILNNDAQDWQTRFQTIQLQYHQDGGSGADQPLPARRSRRKGQFGVLTARYFKLSRNDLSRMIIMLGLAPAVVLLMSLVPTDGIFDREIGLNTTCNMMFVLACACFFIGMFGSISEISKERSIIRREYMTGMSLAQYLMSKIAVLALICLIQTLLMMVCFHFLIGDPAPKRDLIISPVPDLAVTAFLLMLASSSMGLLVSALVSKPDLGVTITVVLLLPQYLFSGLIFEVKGLSEVISWVTVCHWGIEGFGTICDLNGMKYAVDLDLGNGLQTFYQEDYNAMFEFTKEHLEKIWLILLVYLLVCLILTRLSLHKTVQES